MNTPSFLFILFSYAQRGLSLLLLAVICLQGVACSNLASVSKSHVYHDPFEDPELKTPKSVIASNADTVSYWKGGGTGPASIVVNLTQQRAYFYQGNTLAGVALVATGKPGYATPTGSFTILEKKLDKRSSRYGYLYGAGGNVVNYNADAEKDGVPRGCYFEGAPMPYWMRLTSSGVGMHQGFIPVPGQPASHGCIRVSKLVIEQFYEHASVGTPVKVSY